MEHPHNLTLVNLEIQVNYPPKISTIYLLIVNKIKT
jgi:hypothetical protein